jgi:Tol biopolymer transport system component
MRGLQVEPLETRRLLASDAVSLSPVTISRNDGTEQPSIVQGVSDDGRYVLVATASTRLDPGDQNQSSDIYLFDADQAVLVSRDPQGHALGQSERAVLSADGTRVAFERLGELYSYDVATGVVAFQAPGRNPVLSDDGRVMAFVSNADDLVTLDANDVDDVFARDLVSGETVLISVKAAGSGSGNDASHSPVLSADGSVVAFASLASDLVAGDTNRTSDVYARDLAAGTTELISISAEGNGTGDGRSWAPQISADGLQVAFLSDATNFAATDGERTDLFLRNRDGQVTERVSVAPRDHETGDVFSHAFSRDGSTAVVYTWNGSEFAKLTRYAIPSGESAQFFTGPLRAPLSLSHDGRHLAYASTLGDTFATGIWLYDHASGKSRQLDRSPLGLGGFGEFGSAADSGSPLLSGTGNVVVFHSKIPALDTQRVVPERFRLGDFWYGEGATVQQVYAYDIATDQSQLVSHVPDWAAVTRASIAPSELAPNHGSRRQVSGEGRFIVFASAADNLAPGKELVGGRPGFDPPSPGRDVFLLDRLTGQTILVSTRWQTAVTAGGDSRHPAISADGKIVVFESDADGVVPGDENGWRDIFALNRTSGQMQLISAAHGSDRPGNGESTNPQISDDGRWVIFESTASDLVADDGNGPIPDIFAHDLQSRTTHLVSLSSAGISGDGPSRNPRIDRQGLVVVFESLAGNLVKGDTNGVHDVFARLLGDGQTIAVSANAQGTGTGNGVSGQAVPTASGQYVVFASVADDLAAGDTNGSRDIFLRDLASGVTRRVSQPDGGGESDADSWNPTSSHDGRFVVFESDASNLVSGDDPGPAVFVRDVAGERTIRISGTSGSDPDPSRALLPPAISPAGDRVAFVQPHAETGQPRLFVHDLTTQSRIPIKLEPDQAAGSFAFAADGDLLLFEAPWIVPHSDTPPILLADLAPPVAGLDHFQTTANQVLAMDEGTLLQNDTYREPVLALTEETSSELGAAVVVSVAGGFRYDPRSSPQLRNLSPGEVVLDSFRYAIRDGKSSTDSATVVIEVRGGRLLGDANADGRVDFADFVALSGNFGRQGVGWEHGDFDGDGDVDFADFVILSNNYTDSQSRS